MGDQPTDEGRGNSEQGDTDSSILAEGIAKADISKDEKEQSNNTHTDTKQAMLWRKTIRWIHTAWNFIKSTEFTNLAMALATTAIAIFTYLTYEVVHSGSEDTQKLISAAQTQATAADEISGAASDFTDSAYWMEEHMQDAANAMQDSVDTASENTKITIKNAQTAFRDEQRAWVGVLGVESGEFTETVPFQATVVLFNSGKTPARNVLSSVGFKVSYKTISGPTREDIKKLVFRPAQSIAPQGRYNEALGYLTPSGDTSTEDERKSVQDVISRYRDIKAKKAVLYYYGILKYDDVSGRKRSTRFCIYLADPDIKKVAFCEAFNDLD